MPPTTPAPVKEQSMSVPIAIVVAGALIAVSLFFAGQTDGPAQKTVEQGPRVPVFVPVSANDHILGNPNAPVTIIEYTDLECPFCKQFHTSMEAVMKKYGESGQVKWVMRNFPLEGLHPNAPALAHASECVAELAGNTAYWNFLNSIFAQAPINTYFDMTKLSATAVEAGAPAQAFSACMDSGKYRAKIEKEYADAIAAGGEGTPFNVIVTRSGATVAFPGAQPQANIEAAIEQALKN